MESYSLKLSRYGTRKVCNASFGMEPSKQLASMRAQCDDAHVFPARGANNIASVDITSTGKQPVGISDLPLPGEPRATSNARHVRAAGQGAIALRHAFLRGAMLLIGSAFPFMAHCAAASAVPEPIISPAAGTYTSAQTVSIKCSNSSATIHYTTDGTTPTTSSAVYSGSFIVSAKTTISAMAVASGLTGSAVSHSTFTIAPPAAAPVFSLPSAVYNSVQTFTIADSTPGAAVYYAVNGPNATSQSTLYTGPITVSAPANFSAVALAPGGSVSPVAKSYYDIVLPTAVPVVSPSPGVYNAIQLLTLTAATPGSTIYYTLDGTYPNASSPVYRGPIPATTNTHLNAIATAPGHYLAGSLTAFYTIIAPPPTITPQSGTFQNSTTVTMTDAVPGAVVYYTTDGSLPTTSSAVYGGPITVSPQETSTHVYRAIATASGYLQSYTTMASFTISLPTGVLAETTVGETPTRNIPQDFLGLSMDWRQPALVMGQQSTGVNPIYRTLVNNLLANTTAPMLFRVTGDDSQLSGIQSAVEPLAELANAVNVNYALGVDMWNDSLPLAEAEAAAWTSGGIPRNAIQAIEIGNEPDDYEYNSARSRSYSFADYLAQFNQWQQGVAATIGNGYGVMGPSMGNPAHWVPSVEVALITGTMTPTIVSQHAYVGGDTQDGDSPTGTPWPADTLLTPAAAVTAPELFSKYAAATHKAGKIFRMAEINSFWGGLSGVSDTFSSTLWSIDIMFNYLANGVDGVNWSNDVGTTYLMFTFAAPLDAKGIPHFELTQVNPLYYGALAFSQVTGHNAQMLPVTTTTSANVSIWATVDSTSTAHVVVLNKDEHATGDVQITMPGYNTGTVRYLMAANYSAKNGVTLGGQTFDGSPDGTIQGQLTATTITGNNGIFTLPNMPITSAAVVDFSH